MPLTDAPLNASVPAHDIERAMRWYDEKLGVKPALDIGAGGQLYSTGGTNWVIYQTPNAGTGKHTIASWVVPDIEATVKELRANGVQFEDYAMGDEGPTTENGIARNPSGGAAAWFTDSEGNILVITQLPPGMTMPGSAG
jgi:predicted enzyme related to lactoylglutathione lyase